METNYKYEAENSLIEGGAIINNVETASVKLVVNNLISNSSLTWESLKTSKAILIKYMSTQDTSLVLYTNGMKKKDILIEN